MGKVSKICSFGFMVVFFLRIGYLISYYTEFSYDWSILSTSYVVLHSTLILSLCLFCYYFARVLKNGT